MLNFKDKTFCASTRCINECGRKMSEEEKEELNRLNEYSWVAVSYGYFCEKLKTEEVL